MKRLFYAGPRSHTWKGRCEWDSETCTYVSYNKWPSLQATWERELELDVLQVLIDNHEWIEQLPDPALQLLEGM